jgi:cytochrome P450
MIARLSSRIFLPEPLCHDADWLRIATEYTVDFFAAAYALRMVPVALRPIMHWFLPQTRKTRKDVEIATRLIEPELRRRRKEYAQAEKEGRQIKKPVDALTWMETAAQEKGIPAYNLVWGQLNYSLGAIHTTANTFVMAVYDLIERPEYVKLLREEIEAHWDGGALTKSVLYNLKLMDSFMKESQRLNPVTLGMY